MEERQNSLLLCGQNHSSISGEIVEMGLILWYGYKALLQPGELVSEPIPDIVGYKLFQEGLKEMHPSQGR